MKIILGKMLTAFDEHSKADQKLICQHYSAIEHYYGFYKQIFVLKTISLVS